MKRLALIVSVVAMLGACSLALAASLTKPKTGAWKFTDTPGGFQLVAGKGKSGAKLFVTDVHTSTSGAYDCEAGSDPLKVIGRFPMKVVTIPGGYQFWAVGRPGEDPRYENNSRLISVPAKVFVAGKQVPQGGIKLEFNYEDPTEFQAMYIEWGGGKEPGSGFPEPLCVKILGASHH
jgi:hypothetical protein